MIDPLEPNVIVVDELDPKQYFVGNQIGVAKRWHRTRGIANIVLASGNEGPDKQELSPLAAREQKGVSLSGHVLKGSLIHHRGTF